jgi:V-type H+-transporting ATPase subunit a
VNEVRQTEEMERKLRFFETQIAAAGLKQFDSPAIMLDDPNSTDAINLSELEVRLDQIETDLKQINSNLDLLNKNNNGLKELLHVLRGDGSFFSAVASERDQSNPAVGVALEEERGVNLGFVTGVIKRSNIISFERVLWRATRGNLFLRTSEIPEDLVDPNTGLTEKKDVVIIFYQGDRAAQKIRKICESFQVNMYQCPDSPQGRSQMELEVRGRLDDLHTVLNRTTEHKKGILEDLTVHMDVWKAKVLKEKSIYHTMNLFNYDLGRKCLIAEGWCPSNATDDIQLALRRASNRSGALVPSILSMIPPREEPPTYMETNKFTHSFQEIVNAYGIPHYREINPAPFSVATFPFIFALMFGDVGHGTLVLLFTIFMIFKEKEWSRQPLPELLQFPFDGRYVILLMSIASIYIGLLYNECFAIPMDFFGSRFEVCNDTSNAFMCPKAQYLVPNTTDTYTPYPFGVDPAWKGAPNELAYYNSVKMKMSIIVGVLQMTLGIVLYGVNAMYRKDWVSVAVEWIPMIIFMESIFGYMCFLIFYKWVYTDPTYSSNNPPMILPMMINMFLSPAANLTATGSQLYAGQTGVQIFLLIIALISVPIMLLPKPFILKRRAEQRNKGFRPLEGHEVEVEEFEFGEVMIHQVIHVIEFTLGSVSNTASYLRLWALSLAHSELATVFYEKVWIQLMELSVTKVHSEATGSESGAGEEHEKMAGYTFAAFFIAFQAWGAATLGVLCVMEALSAFLHGLRLHWVEFQNKFYQGDGRRFQPFSYAKILEAGQVVVE